MVLYFSATGNTRFVATELAKALDDEAMDLCSRIKTHNYESCRNSEVGHCRFAGTDSIAKPDSLLGRFVLRGAAPYMSVDGMNDQGLGISILSLTNPERRPDTGKTENIKQQNKRASSPGDALFIYVEKFYVL